MTQFAFLAPEFQDRLDPARRAELAALTDPRGACFYARLALEVALKQLFRSDPALKTPYDYNLAALIAEPSLTALTGPAIVAKARFVKDNGNRAVHDARSVSEGAAIAVLKELHHICYWIVRTYAKGAKPDAGLVFEVSKLERTLTISASTVDQIKKLKADFDAAVERVREAEKARLTSEEGSGGLGGRTDLPAL